MAATSWTQEHVIALEGAIQTGALEVFYADKKVKYRSLDEMLRLLGVMRAAIENANTPTDGLSRKRRVASFDKAL